MKNAQYIKKTVLTISFLLWCSLFVCADETYMGWRIEQIYQDIYAELVEEGYELDFEQLVEDLEELRDQPINLNNCSAAELQRLRILSNEQIDNILRYAAKGELHTLYELRLITGLQDYEIRDILPFVTIGERERPKLIAREVFKYAKQEVDIRADVRDMESYDGDPLYYSLKYKFNYQNRVQFGLIAERDAQENWWGDHYGGYLQLDNFGKLRRLVVGDFDASLGMGLVINTQSLFNSKIALLTQQNFTDGNYIKKHSSVRESGFLRGCGASFRIEHLDFTAFYSARKIDGAVDGNSFPTILETGYHRTDTEKSHKRQVWQQVAGVNFTLNVEHWRVGVTAVEMALSKELSPKPNYYNADYFHGKNQFAASFNFEHQLRYTRLFGEFAMAQNQQWGYGGIVGAKIVPTEGISMLAIYRYYSPTFDCVLGQAIGESAHNNDENGGYIGLNINRLTHWRFTLMGDVFHFLQPKYQLYEPTTGYEVVVTADYEINDHWAMQWKVRAKQKVEAKYNVRYWLSCNYDGLRCTAILHTNYVQDKGWGYLASADVRYEWVKPNIMLQGRVEGFYMNEYSNRFYEWENDVLYAMSFPMQYGQGLRYYLNAKYKINNHLSFYLRLSDTYYAKAWTDKKHLDSPHRTDLHLMLRVTW